MSEDADTITLATELTAAWLANPNTRVSPDDVPALLASVHDALGKLSSPEVEETREQPAEQYTPAVSVRKSLASPDHIISMIDGKPYRVLKRHLSTNGLTPAQYRERYGLKADYPMVAPSFSAARSAMSKHLGLGRKPGQKTGGVAPQADAPAPTKTRASRAPSTPTEPAKAKPRKRRGVSEAKGAAKAHLGGDIDG